MTLSKRHLAWWEARGISGETADRLQIFSAKRAPDGSVVADPNGEIMVFPFIQDGRDVGEKYRGPQKVFWQKKGNYKTFFNADVLNYPELEDPEYPLVITEGEPDCASYLEIGYDFVVSVPDGAPQESNKPVPETADDVDPEHDKKYEYIVNNWDKLKKAKKIVLSCDGTGDGNGAGWRLAQELARRLGRSRCYYVIYPEVAVVPTEDGGLRPCKDANEVLIYLGPEALRLMLARARPFPVRGLYELDEIPDQDELELVSTGIKALDRDPKDPKKPWLAIYPSLFMPVSGVPAGGKTAIVTQIQFNLAYYHGWVGAIASFEMPVKPVLRDMLRSFYIYLERVKAGRDPAKWHELNYHGQGSLTWSKAEIFEADAFIREHFKFILLSPDDDESEADIGWVIDRAHDALIRYGIRSLVLDPWNEVAHRRRPGESVADYTNRAVMEVKRLAHARDIASFVICHPDKTAGRKNADGEPLSLYDISDGATWVNKAEHGAMVRRLDPNGSMTEFDLKKVKFRGTGRTGPVVLNYLPECEVFDPFCEDLRPMVELSQLDS